MTTLATLQVSHLAALRESYSVSWFLIILSVILGLMVTLRPAKRTSEIKYKIREEK
jgi:hypothetical protein